MPGTDGPRQFPCSQTPLSGAGGRGVGGGGPPGGPPQPRPLYTGPKPECEITGVQLMGELFFLLPHTPTHTVSESPNVP